MSEGFDLILSRFDARVGKLARHTRMLITDAYPRIVAVPWPNQNVIGYGVGPHTHRALGEHVVLTWLRHTKRGTACLMP